MQTSKGAGGARIVFFANPRCAALRRLQMRHLGRGQNSIFVIDDGRNDCSQINGF